MVLAVGLGVGVSVGGCGAVGPGDGNPECADGDRRCLDGNFQECREERWVVAMECVAPTVHCSEGLGCFSCLENTTFCDGDDLRSCGADGSPGAVLASCDATPHGVCAGGGCTTPCDQAAASDSYLGCDYWPTPLANAWLSLSFAQNFGVVVHNPHDEAARVVVTRGEEVAADRIVGAGALEIFTLLVDTGLKLSGGEWNSYSVPHGAYHLTSTLPVAAYQFNPLDYDLSNEQYNMLSYTNDAALLLPTHVLTGNYLAVSRATSGVNDDGPGFDLVLSPGFVTIVGTAPDTQVSVTSSCHVAAGLTGTMAPIAPMAPGDVQHFVLQPGEALQLLSEVGQNYNTPDLGLDGDPAFALQVPLAQFRADYTFLAPSTFPDNYVNIIKRVGEGGPTVTLDGTPVDESSFGAPVGGSPYGVARIPISGAAHHITATEPVGIMVYGFARYTSYLYPGGLDLHHINPVL